jgi:alpha-N-acetylglucosamine transferase
MQKYVIRCEEYDETIYLRDDGVWVENIDEAYEFPEELAEILAGYMNELSVACVYKVVKA